jgi:hypothetical protein
LDTFTFLLIPILFLDRFQEEEQRQLAPTPGVAVSSLPCGFMFSHTDMQNKALPFSRFEPEPKLVTVELPPSIVQAVNDMSPSYVHLHVESTGLAQRRAETPLWLDLVTSELPSKACSLRSGPADQWIMR